MRKKILATLLALCMVIGLLPITALAAELTDAQKKALKDQGYTDEQIENVMVIDEDTEISEDFDGLIVVIGSVNVTVKGANIGVGLVVAPGATDAKIVLGENAVVNAVVALEKADITVSETAQATNLTVVAADTVVKVDGTVSNLGAASTAEKVTITVSEKATVSTMNVSAPNAKAEIAGTVGTVNVEETAVGAALTVAETGTVTTASVAAPDVAVTVDGTMTNMEVTETATGAQVSGANADKVEVTGSTDNVTTSTDNGTVEVGVGGSVEVGSNHMAAPAIVAAPLGNKMGGNVVYAPGYNVKIQENASNNKMFDVTIVGTIPKHKSSSYETGTTQGFFGLAIPLPTRTTEKGVIEKTVEYNYYVIQTTTLTWTDESGKVLRTDTKTRIQVANATNSDVSGLEMNQQGITAASLNAMYDTIYFTEAFAKHLSDAGDNVTGTSAPTWVPNSAAPESAAGRNNKVSFEIIVVDQMKDPFNSTSSDGVVTSLACDATRSGGLDEVYSAAISDAIADGRITASPSGSMSAWTDDMKKANEIGQAAQKKLLEDAADMIFNIKTDVKVTDAEFVKSGDGSADPEVTTSMPSFGPGESKVITAPKGEGTKETTVSITSPSPSSTIKVELSDGAAAAAKDYTVPSNAPAQSDYITADPTLPANP